MNAFVNLALSIVLFHVGDLSALDVRIETIEDDGTRDEWTFEDANLTSELRSSSSSSSVIVRLLSRITTMGGAHRSGFVTELRLECGDGIRVDAGFRKRVPLRYCSDKKRMFILSSM